MSLKYIPYSFSKISTFNSCPKKFEYNYILKLEDKTDTPALAKGRAVHSILEYYPEFDNSLMHADPIYTEAKEICDNFLNSDLGKKYILNDLPKFSEEKIALDINLNPCDYKDKNVLFKGIVDQIIIGNTLFLNDFKTGRYKDERYQSYDQLMFYAIYFFIKYTNIMEIHISYLYVEHNIENSLVLERKFLNNYIKTLITNIKKIEETIEFNKNESKLCDFCGFNEICLYK